MDILAALSLSLSSLARAFSLSHSLSAAPPLSLARARARLAVSGAYEVLCFLIPAILRLSGWLGDPGQAWLHFWHWWLSVNGCLAVGFSIWFIIGGLRDLRVPASPNMPIPV